MAIERWDPLVEFTPLREAVSRLLGGSFVGPNRFDAFSHIFPMDIRETDGEYVIEASLPGFTPEDVQVMTHGDTLTIRAERNVERGDEKAGTYVRRERYEGEVRRAVTLASMYADGVKATYQHGVLTVHVPKATQVQGKTIPVQALPEGGSH
jgi:HSP20 family protein